MKFRNGRNLTEKQEGKSRKNLKLQENLRNTRFCTTLENSQ